MLRFYGNMTQDQIGQHLGISQMHVSRLLTHALTYLRERITDPQPGPADTEPTSAWPDQARYVRCVRRCVPPPCRYG
ncbi:MAG: sigma factor-like helix-turn-helix DNA-binding protein [Streptosporangiaceae bacterium]